MGKRTQIPGTERVVNKSVESAMSSYVEARDKRMALSKKETAARLILIDAMKKAGVEEYTDEDFTMKATYTATEGVKVRAISEDSIEE